MSHKIEILSESLDKMNMGIIPETNDQELSDLLEVAALLRKSGINAPPPEHILAASVERSVAGLATQKQTHRKSLMYSGLLGAAAALLVFFGLHGLPSPQKVSTIVTPPPQAAKNPPAEKASPGAIIPPTDTTVQEQSTPTQKPDSAVPAESSPAASPKPSRPKTPATPSVTPPQPPVADAPSRQENHAAPSLKAFSSPRSAEQTAPPAAYNVLRLPGRTPDFITHDSSAGSVRQVYDQGTANELIITRRITPSVKKGANRKTSPRRAAKADSAKSLAFQDSNKVVIFIKGQEVTLEGRQTLQELTELGEKLKAANP